MGVLCEFVLVAANAGHGLLGAASVPVPRPIYTQRRRRANDQLTRPSPRACIFKYVVRKNNVFSILGNESLHESAFRILLHRLKTFCVIFQTVQQSPKMGKRATRIPAPGFFKGI